MSDHPAQSDPGLSPDAAARALRRAVARRVDPEDLIPLEELLAVGREIGVTDADVAAAVAVERAGGDPSPPGGLRDRVTGPPAAVTVRVAGIPRGDLEARLADWLRAGHCMHPVRRDPAGAEWVPDDGLAAAVRRQMRAAIGAPALRDVRVVRYRLGVAGDLSAVRLEAEAGSREAAEAGAAVFGVAGLAGGVVLAVVASPLALALAPVGLAAGAALLVGRRRRVDAVQRAMEGLADAVVHGDSPPRARDALLPGTARRRAESWRTPPDGG